MEKGEAQSVLTKPRTQIVPTLNRMHRFVVDDALKYSRGRVPVNGTQLQKAAIKPGHELVLEVGIDSFEFRVLGKQLQ